MTDAQLIEALTSCYDAGWLGARNVENRYDTDEDLQKRAEAVVAKALAWLARDNTELGETVWDYHTAIGAETPHVSVFTTLEDGTEDGRIADFYPLHGEDIHLLTKAEERAVLLVMGHNAKVTE